MFDVYTTLKQHPPLNMAGKHAPVDVGLPHPNPRSTTIEITWILLRNIRQASKYNKLLIGFKSHPELIAVLIYNKNGNLTESSNPNTS